MEDLIYILLGLAWVVFSVIKGVKKNQTPHTTERPKSELEEIFGEFFPSSKEEEPEYDTLEDNSPEYLEEEVKPASIFDAYSGEMNEVEITSLEDAEISGVTFIHEEIKEKVENNERFEHIPSFNLRQAIIYQTVLQRPEY
jgi:hypothetical protein